jgi:hypothetical protein
MLNKALLFLMYQLELCLSPSPLHSCLRFIVLFLGNRVLDFTRFNKNIKYNVIHGDSHYIGIHQVQSNSHHYI